MSIVSIPPLKMFGRAFTQIILIGSQILVKALAETYKHAAANASKSAKSAGMTLDEAAKILAVDKKAAMQDVTKRFEHLFNANDPTKGGSFYLQSKVFRAKERFSIEQESAKTT